MSRVVEAVDDVVAGIPVVRDIWDGIKDVVDKFWQEVADPIIEFVLGLFGIHDEEITHVQRQSIRLLKDNVDEKDLSVLAALRHQVHNESILANLVASKADTVAKYRMYHREGESFIDGYPTGSLKTAAIPTSTIEGIVTSEVLPTAIVVSVRAETPTKYEWTYHKLRELYAFNPASLEFTYGGQTYVYTDSLYDYTNNYYIISGNLKIELTTTTTVATEVIVTSFDDTNDQIQTIVTENIVVVNSNTSEEVSSITTEISNIVTYELKDTIMSSYEEVVTVVDSVEYEAVSNILNIEAYNLIQHYIVTFTDSSTNISGYYWVYDYVANVNGYTLPANEYTVGLEVLPIVALRLDKQNINTDKTSIRYQSSVDICKTIGADIDAIIASISENPDVEYITEAFLNFAVSPADTSPAVSEYLYRMLDFLHNNPTTVEEVTHETLDEEGNVESSWIEKVLYYKISEGEFNTVARWTGLFKNKKVGNIGNVGTYTHNLETIEVEAIDDEGTPYTETIHRLAVNYQIDETSYYQQIIEGLSSMTYIDYGGKGNLHTTSLLNDTNDAFNPNFTFSLTYEIVKTMSVNKQTELFVTALRVDVYAQQVQYIEYWQSRRLTGVLEFVSIVLMFYSLEGSTLLQVLIKLLIYYASSMALKEILESGAADWVKAIAAIAYVYVNVTYAGGDDLSPVMTAVQVVSLTTNVMATGLSVKQEDLAASIDKFNREAEESYATLEEKQEANLVIPRFTAEEMLKLVTPRYINNEVKMGIAKGALLYNPGILYQYSSQCYDYNRMFKVGITS